MARIPKKAKAKIDEILGSYTENNSLELFDVLHLYDSGKHCITRNTGYHDSKHFTLVGFNTTTKEKRDLGYHDGIEFTSERHLPPIKLIRIFVDGAMLVRFYHPIPLIHHTANVYYEYTNQAN